MDRELHNQKIADHFSGRKDFWRSIYEPSGYNLDFFDHITVLKRKDAVLRLVENCADGRSLHILDAGCGTGIFAREIILRNHVYFGIDISPKMIETARETLSKFPIPAGTLKVGSVENLDFDDHSFDLCLCIGVLQYLKDDEIALKELYRVTKPNGHIIVSIPNIARITTLTDPYYYFYRAPLFIRSRLLKSGNGYSELSSMDIGKNLSFQDRRYFYAKLHSLFARNRLAVRKIIPIGYGPITVWGRICFSKSFTFSATALLEGRASRRGFSFLKALANRWVILLRKI